MPVTKIKSGSKAKATPAAASAAASAANVSIIPKTQEAVGEAVHITSARYLLTHFSETAEAKKLVSDADTHRKKIVSYADGLTKTDEVVIELPGVGVVKVGAPGEKKVVDVKAVFNYLPLETFLKLASISATDLEKYVPAHDLPKMVSTTAGNRITSVTPVA